MINSVEVREKLFSDYHWTKEEEENQELFGFLSMSCYKLYLKRYMKKGYSKHYSKVDRSRYSHLLKKHLALEFSKFDLNLESDLGKAFSKALAFVLLFPDVKLNKDFQSGCVFAQIEDVF